MQQCATFVQIFITSNPNTFGFALVQVQSNTLIPRLPIRHVKLSEEESAPTKVAHIFSASESTIADSIHNRSQLRFQRNFILFYLPSIKQMLRHTAPRPDDILNGNEGERPSGRVLTVGVRRRLYAFVFIGLRDAQKCRRIGRRISEKVRTTGKSHKRKPFCRLDSAITYAVVTNS